MFETSGGSPTLGAYGDCCSCCAKVRVATPASANTPSALAPHATSVLFIVVASLFARTRVFPDCCSNCNTAKAGAPSPLCTTAPCVIGQFLRWSGTRLWPTIRPPPNDGGNRAHKSRTSVAYITGRQRMPRKLLLCASAMTVGLLWSVPHLAAQTFVDTPTPPQFQAQGQPSTKNGEWPSNGADLAFSRYSPLDQINASNFDKLQVAWRFKTDNFGPYPEYKLEGTPIMIRGVLYTTAGTRRSVIALDAKTGELLWSHSLREGARATHSPRQLSGRGLAYWTDGAGDERIIYVTTGYRLVQLNAKTGALVNGFGSNGIVDLKGGVVRGNEQQIDLETGEIGVHTAPTVVGDMVIVGSAMKEGATVASHNNTKGLVRAFDIRTGKQIWRFDTIPRPGQPGNETWENNSWAINGNVGVWTHISADPELGLVYLPVETPTSDYYGGHRPGDNLYAESLVAVDMKTGVRKWHFQFVHHPLWNWDMTSAPILADITVNGRAIKAVAVGSKQGWLYVFDRVTGQPVWPIEERPVPQSDVPGEKTAATQPH